MSALVRKLLARFKLNRTSLGYAGYAMFFFACLFIAAYVTFPYDRLRDFLLQQIAGGTQATVPGAPAPKVTLGEIGPTWTLGIAVEGVRFEQAAAQAGGMPVAIAIDEVDLHPSLLSLLIGRPRVGFSASVGEGSIDGTLTTSGATWTLDAELDAVDLATLGLGSMLGLPVAGVASGEIALAAAEEPSGDEGKIQLHVEGVVLGDGKAKVALPGMGAGLTVEAIKAGDLDVDIAIHEGVAAIEKFHARGADLELDAGGAVRLGRPFARSRVDLTLDLKFADAFKERNDRTRALFQLMAAQPLLKRAAGADGSMRFAVTGTPQALRTRPAGGTAAARPARRGAKTPTAPE